MIAVLVENTGNPEGPSGEKVGLYSAVLAGSPAPITLAADGRARADRPCRTRCAES